MKKAERMSMYLIIRNAFNDSPMRRRVARTTTKQGKKTEKKQENYVEASKWSSF